MNSSFKVESGVQLLARLTRRPSLDRLWPGLVTAQLPAGAVLEVTGVPGAGKSLLVADAICHALLPRRCGGCGAGVVVFSTDGNLNVRWIITSLQERIMEAVSSEESSSKIQLVESIMAEILPNLNVANVYDSVQLLVSVENLESILTDNPDISLLVVDTLTAFYWSDQGTKLQKMDSYLKSLLRKIQKVTKEHRVTILYTKPQYFGTKQDGLESVEACVKDPTLEKANCRIQVNKCDNLHEKNTYQIMLSTYEETSMKYFKLNQNILVWL